ncbi:DUF4168 domain-containing protein [Sphingomonas qomolangmaensis]|uniref:DUF4168 domain-containing protein n=1 Tax=Sphingomonas qomolangmaensis TaxID=2918765 RepID=A0ABY5LA76_9SPHN|nr:DUF4168 domain-containing protein [Sphingomonas qomolangmaensis]UUL82943.1 DUF4168 domain-containing protein [Sphingomonas qomolangmaensis]
MNTFNRTLIAAGMMAVAAPAFAQSMAPTQTAPDAQMQPAPTTGAPTSSTAPTTAAPATSSGPISDTDVSQFAKAVVAVEAVQKDTTIAAADKQTKMAEKVQATGLDPAKFNQIAQTMQSDPALQAKISAAVQAENGGAAPAQPAQ